jgi:hypothetical protein
MTTLDRAIEELYQVFSRYGKPRAIEVCPCGCTRTDAIKGLLDKPLVDLSLEDLARYSTHAMTTAGTEADFKYFLPRLLDRITVEQYFYPAEFVFGKLRYANWSSWPQDEQSTVREFLHALWSRVIHEYPLVLRNPNYSNIIDALSSIGSTGEDLSWYLDLWDEADSQASTLNLAELVLEQAHDLKESGNVKFAFWDKLPKQVEQLSAWLKRPVVLHRLRGANLSEIERHLTWESIPKALSDLEAAVLRG